jgi:hypothetical protein
MAFNFGTNNNTIPAFNGFNNNMFTTQQQLQPSNLKTFSTNNRDYAENFPMSPGETAVFMNYNGRRLYIKTQNQNGLSYEMEEMIILKPEEFQQLQQAAVQNNIQQNQNGNHSGEIVTTEMLKNQANELLKSIDELELRVHALEDVMK